MTFFEVSPLCNFNVTESFTELSRIVLMRHGMEKIWRPNRGEVRPVRPPGLRPECRAQWTGDSSEVLVPPRCLGSPAVELPQRATTKPTCILHVLYLGVPEL